MSESSAPRRTARLSIGGLDLSHVIVLVLGVAGGGGVGTFASTGLRENSFEAFMLRFETFRVEVLGRLDSLATSQADLSRRITALEQNLRDHERTPAHVHASLKLQEVERRLKQLEEPGPR